MELKRLQEVNSIGDDTKATTQEEENYRIKSKETIIKEGVFLKKRSHISWLSEGDRNTSFLHRSTSKHKKNGQTLSP